MCGTLHRGRTHAVAIRFARSPVLYELLIVSFHYFFAMKHLPYYTSINRARIQCIKHPSCRMKTPLFALRFNELSGVITLTDEIEALQPFVDE